MNLITGATGLLGTHIALELLARGQQVRALARTGSSLESMKKVFAHYGSAELFHRIEWVEGELEDVTSLIDALENCTTVYHCAAIVSYHPADRRQMYKVNVEGTANLVNACIDRGKLNLAHVSSIAAIGRTKESITLNENSEWVDGEQTTHYAITKHLAEMEVWRGIQEGLNAVILNSGLIIGPGDFTRSSGGMFTRIDQGIPFFPPGGTGFISAPDAARALVELMHQEKFGERYIAVAENKTMRDVFTKVAGSLGKKAPIKQVTPFLLVVALFMEQMKEWFTGKKALVTREVLRNMERQFIYDNSKLKDALGFSFQSIDAAIDDTGRFYQTISGRK